MHTTLKMEYLVSMVIIICNLFIATTKYRFRFPFKEVLKVFSFFTLNYTQIYNIHCANVMHFSCADGVEEIK